MAAPDALNLCGNIVELFGYIRRLCGGVPHGYNRMVQNPPPFPLSTIRVANPQTTNRANTVDIIILFGTILIGPAGQSADYTLILFIVVFRINRYIVQRPHFVAATGARGGAILLLEPANYAHQMEPMHAAQNGIAGAVGYALKADGALWGRRC
jgi:hypothetical protein